MRISQREARRLRQRVSELERQEDTRRNVWARDYPGGANICTAQFLADGKVPVAIRTARLLNHAVVCVASDDGAVLFMALPLAKVTR